MLCYRATLQKAGPSAFHPSRRDFFVARGPLDDTKEEQSLLDAKLYVGGELLPGVLGFLVERIGGEFDQLQADATGVHNI
jgi:hypothetical protein